MIHYNTPAAKYTGALQGDYTGDLPPSTSNYTKMIESILKNKNMTFPETEILRSIYALYSGKIDLQPPSSRLATIIQFGVYPDRFTIESISENEMTVYDSETGMTGSVYLDDNLEKIWAKIVYKGNEITSNLISADGFFLRSTNGYLLNCVDLFQKNYTVLKSVDTDENMYINTDYVFTEKTRVVIDCIPLLEGFTNPFPFLFGTSGGERFWNEHAWAFAPNSSRGTLYARGHNTSTSTPIDFDYSQRSVITFEGNIVYLQYDDSITVTYTDEHAVVTDGVLPLWLFTFSHTSEPQSEYYSKTRFYSCQIYEGDILVRDFIPVKRNADCILMLYDMVEMKEYIAKKGNFSKFEEL